MNFKVIASCDFQVDAPWSLEGQVLAISSFERRLIRCWRVGLLPHEITGLLSITNNNLVNKLKSLSSAGVDLSPDTRTEAQYLNEAGNAETKQRVSNEQLADMVEDFDLYTNYGIRNCIIALLLECPQHYLQFVKSKSRTVRKSQKADVQFRNKSIVSAFKSRRGEVGIKSSLAKEFGLSRRAIDFILEEEMIDHRLTKRKPRKRSDKVTDRYREISERYVALFVDGKAKRGTVSKVAGEYGITTPGLIRILKDQGVYQPTNASKSKKGGDPEGRA